MAKASHWWRCGRFPIVMSAEAAAQAQEGSSGVSLPLPRPGPVQRALFLGGQCLLATPRALAWLPPLAWAAFIFYLSSGQLDIGDLGGSPLGGFMTNLAHPGAFGLFALLLIPMAQRVPHGWGGRWTGLTPEGALWVVVIASIYGFSDELHQSTVEGRDASLLDLISDAVGAFFVVLVVRYLGRPDSTERGLRRRLLWGLSASFAAAAASTAYAEYVGRGPWPF